MTVSETMILAGAKALHEEWRASILPGGSNHSMRGIIKDETLFSWENLHPENRDSYLRTSRTALTAALSDMVVVPRDVECVHHVDGEDGPTCGLHFKLDDKRTLWCGEISNALFDDNDLADADIGNSGGWWIVLYDETKPQGQQAEALGKAIDRESAGTIGLMLALGCRAMIAAAPPSPVGGKE